MSFTTIARHQTAGLGVLKTRQGQRSPIPGLILVSVLLIGLASGCASPAFLTSSSAAGPSRITSSAEPVDTSVDQADQYRTTPLTSDKRPPLRVQIHSDYRNFYSTETLTPFMAGLAGGALMANSNFDETVQKHFQSSIRNASTDEWFEGLRAQKELGNGYYTIPVFAAAWATGALFEDSAAAGHVGEWGERSIRSILVGAPPMLATQAIVGGSRPHESSSGSRWTPFQDNNGVSGHAFMGSLPFMTAAQVAEEPWLKAFFYTSSTLVPLSRINDDAHYTSQAFLGWWIALLSTQAVDRTQATNSQWQFRPWLDPGTSGIAIERRY